MRPFLYLCLLICFSSCKAQENIQQKRVLTETKNLLNTYFNLADNGDGKFANQILHEIDHVPWTDSLIPQQLWSLRNFKIKEMSDIIDFEALFDKKDIHHFHSTSKNFNIKNWSEIMEHPILVNNTSGGVLLSSPAFDKNYKHAIFYLEDNSSGSLILFKKENDQWTFFASGMLWIR